MAKKKIPSKFREKKILERQLKERKTKMPPRKKLNWRQFLRALPKKISKFFRDVIHELKRVSWPTREELFIYTVIVLVTIAFFSVVLGLFDFAFLRLVELLIRF